MTRGFRAVACLALAISSCTASPEAVLERARVATERGEIDELRRVLHSRYVDPLGGPDEVVRDIEALVRDFPQRKVAFSELTVGSDAPNAPTVIVGRLDAEWIGTPTWRVVGPIRVELEINDGLRIRAGWLTDVRDIRGLMDARRAALEANDAAALRELVHPNYRDGDLGRDEAIARLAGDIAGHKVRMSSTNYRLELRGPVAHVDEHYAIAVDDRAASPAIARFTLARAAGRWKIAAGLYPAK